jgi:ABC-type uncharacterized transport system, auxiliary component
MTGGRILLAADRGRRGGLTRAVLLAALAVSLAGCTSFFAAGGGKPAAIYDLAIEARPAGDAPARGRSRAQLLVPKPTALAALDSNRVVVNPKPAEIAYFPGVQWSDGLTNLVQIKLVRAFEDSGRAKAVGVPGESLAIDYQVIVDIRSFAYDATTDRARVELGVKLLNDRDGQVVGTTVVSAEAPAPSDAAADVVAALGSAASRAIGDLVAWSLRTI